MAKTNEFETRSGKKVTLNMSNNQSQLRPGRYQYIDADLSADMCEALGHAEAKTDDLFKEMMRAGLEAIGLNVDDYSLERAPTKPVRNKSVNPEWLTQYEAGLEAKKEKAGIVAKANKTGDKLFIQFGKAMEAKILETGKQLNNEQIENAIKNSNLDDHNKDALRKHFIKATTKQPEELNFSF